MSETGERRHILVREVCLADRPESVGENVQRTSGTAYAVD
jgi:hypothetical protein